MYYGKHGGDCCGVSHVYNFMETMSEKDFLKLLNKAFNKNKKRFFYVFRNPSFYKRAEGGHMIEVTITQHQSKIRKLLEKYKFEKGITFINGNSGNSVTFYYLFMQEPFKI